MLEAGRGFWPRRPRDARSDCTGKTTYMSKGAAIDCIKRRMKRRKGDHKNGWRGKMILAPYKCPHCQHWHVGGTEPWDVRTGRPRRKYYD